MMYRWDLGETHLRLGELEATAGNRDAARTELQTSLSLREAAAAADPGNADRAKDVANTRAALSSL